MKDLFAKIDAEPVRTPRASFNVGAWLSSIVSSFQPRTLAYAAGAAAIALLLQAGIITNMLVQTGGNFTVASIDKQAEDTGAYVLIRFNPHASVEDISKFLSEQKATIAGGPAAGSGLRLPASGTARPRHAPALLPRC